MLYVVLALADGGTDPGFRSGAAIFLWVVVILGLALTAWPRAAIPRPALVAGVCLGGFAALSALSLAWSEDTGATFNEVIRVLTYLGVFVAVVLASSAGGARPWLHGLALGIAVVAGIAILSRFVPSLFSAAETLREDLPPATRRLSFPSTYWNGLGVSMAVGMLLFTWIGAEARTRLWRAAATAAMPVAGLALLLTSSRGSAIAAGVGMLVLLLLGRSRPQLIGSLVVGGGGALVLIAVAHGVGPEITRGNLYAPAADRQGDVLVPATLLIAGATGLVRYIVDEAMASFRAPPWAGRAVVTAGVVVALAGLVAINPIDAVESFCDKPKVATSNPNSASHLASASSSGRCQYWESGFDAFASAPVAGIGAGGFGAWWGEHHTLSRPVIFVHSLFIGALAELGIAGLALIVAFFAVVAVAGVRGWRGNTGESTPAIALAVLAAGTLTTTFDWMWEFPSAFAPSMVAAALLAGPALFTGPQPGRSRFGFGVAALVVGWIAVVASLLSVFGEGKTGDSRDSLQRGDLGDAIDAAGTASTLTPWAAQPYLIKAAAYEGRENLTAAEDAVHEALERDPGDWTVWAVAARISAAQGDVEGALGELSEANRRNPSVGNAPKRVFSRFGLERDELEAPNPE